MVRHHRATGSLLGASREMMSLIPSVSLLSLEPHSASTSLWWHKVGRGKAACSPKEEVSLTAGAVPAQSANSQKAESSSCKEAGCLGQQLYQWIISWKEETLWRPCTIFDLGTCTQYAGLAFIQRKQDNCFPNILAEECIPPALVTHSPAARGLPQTIILFC